MSSPIRNPAALAKRTAQRRLRRRRANYPKLAAGQSMPIAREECGTTRRMLPRLGRAQSPTQLLVEQFIFKRAIPGASSSIYEPHVGKKQLSRKLRP